MDAAKIGLLGAVAAALIAALAATIGPLTVQRRKERADSRQRLEDAVARRIDVVNNAGVCCRAWLTFLVRVLEDAQAGRVLPVDDFDEKSEPLRSAAESALAQAVHVGYELLDSELAHAMRSVESAVRSALLNPADAPLDQLRDRANAYFEPREVIRTHMLREVTRLEKPTDPLAGTVFDSRRLPAR
ncbi:hypothetical protein [Micrococcus sp. HSID17227]|uniref:hypothetical protein n=1 Tax=Micrococcus sp. HSID17227 TaxID=2419506 RepID=UPI000FA6EAE5|nr:hypothetical protein [Micrococcus sp. HSID17227]RUQ37492.1 hypothetical protein D8M29_12405 [Micrococcus sp. HSID17227]